jgi:hypothetical protein
MPMRVLSDRLAEILADRVKNWVEDRAVEELSAAIEVLRADEDRKKREALARG